MATDKPALNMVHFTLPAHEVSNAFSQADLAETAIAEVDFPAATTDISSIKVIMAIDASEGTRV